jgi:hypothetical protein
VGEIGVAYQRADPQGAIGQSLDAVEPGNMADVDDALGARGTDFHQVEQIGARGKILSARCR